MNDNRCDKASPRLFWIDSSRGLAIALVVLGHVISNSISAKALTGGTWQIVYDFIYAFHMPLFFYVSGYLQKFNSQSDWRHESRRWGEKFLGLAIPYVVFSVLYVMAKVVFSHTDAVMNPVSASSLLGMAIRPISEYWFLYALLVLECFYNGSLALLSACGQNRFRVPLLVALFCAGVLCYCFDPLQGTALSGLRNALKFMPFFFAGTLAHGWFDLPFRAMLSTCVATALSACLYAFKFTRTEFVPIAALFLAFSMIALIVGGSHFLGRSGVLGMLGKNTMPIYLIHPFVLVPGRLLLHKFGIRNECLYVLALTCSSIVFPLILQICLLKRVKFLDFFVYPRHYLHGKESRSVS